MKWQRWHAVAAAAVVAIGFFSLGKCGNSPSSAVDAGTSLEAPANTPEDLIADIYVSSPNASWTKLQRGVGGAMGILPTTLPGAIVALTELDPNLSGELDGTAPMFGVVAGTPAQPTALIAIKLVDPRRARGMLADGETSRFTTQDVAGMTMLVPRSSGRSAHDRKLEMALSPNGYLLVTMRPADLGRLGPYVTRTLPPRFAASPKDGAASAVVEIPRSAIAKVLAPGLDSMWKEGKAFLLAQDEQMRAQKGRAPDFGDPAAIVAALDGMLSRRITALSDLEKVRIAIDITDDAAVVSATLTPTSSAAGPGRKWIDGMKVGDLAPVLALPSTAALALSTRDGEAEREDQSKELEKAITTSLGARLKDASKLHEVIEATTKARDESLSVAFAIEEPTGLLLRAPVRDAAALDKAIRGVFDLTKAEPFKELLHARDVTSANEELPGLGKITLLTLARDPSKQAPRPHAATRPDAGLGALKAGTSTSPNLGVAWLTDQGQLALGAGAEALVTLKVGARPDHKLADEPSLKRFTSAVGADATTVIIGQPLRLDPKRANLPLAPLGIAVGRRGGDAFVQIDIADGLLREAARWQMGF